MRQWYLPGIIGGLCTLFAATAFAELDIEVTQGIRGAVPIAVVPFAGESKQLAKNLSQVVQADLHHSGRFKVAELARLPGQPHRARDVQAAAWRKQGIDAVLVGEVSATAEHRYRVHYALVSTQKTAPLSHPSAQRAKSASPGAPVNQTAHDAHVLAEQTFVIKPPQLRRLAHLISDSAFEKLTGIRGVFSTKIAYVLVRRAANKPPRYLLEVSDADGHQPRPLLSSYEPIMSPAWAPDGQRIAYVSFEKRRPQIFIENVITGERRRMAAFWGINSAPAWSPDGKRLALVISRGKHPKIYTVDLKTKTFKQVTWGNAIDTEPSWAPDGRSIIFTSNRGGGPQIYRVQLGSRKVRRVTYDGVYNARASYLPTQNQIVMLHSNGGAFSIATQDLDSGQVQVLTTAGLNESPSVAANGRMVLYATRHRNKGVLAIASTDGQVQLRLPAPEGDVQEPAWSPYQTLG